MYPLSGPVQGGTVVTITVSDLGVDVNSIDSVMFGEYQCFIIPSDYQPGKKNSMVRKCKNAHLYHHAGRSIKCTTSAATNVQSEDVIIKIVVNRGESEPVMATPQFAFAYKNPVVTAVFPRFGPISGGTMVSIKGSSLNIGGDDSTVITLAGQNCVIRYNFIIACIFLLHL